MKIAVFGATGKLGQHFVKAALNKGHIIVAYARSPHKLKITHNRLKIIEGDIFDTDKITAFLEGVDAVLTCLRLKTQRIPLFSQGTQTIINAMKNQNVKRLILISEAAYGEHMRNFGWITRVSFRVYGAFQKFQLNERRKQDSIVYESGLDWSVFRVRTLTNKSKKKSLQTSLEPKKSFSGGTFRGHLAEEILNQLDNPEEYLQKNIYI